YALSVKKVAGAMTGRFTDEHEGGFFDLSSGPDAGDGLILGALAARRKPLQDSPTPAGNPSAAIALLRLHAFTNNERYRTLAERTLSAFAGIAAHYGLFCATYGIALDMYLRPHTQVVVAGSDERASSLLAAASRRFSLNKSVLHLAQGEIVPQMLPSALANTIPSLLGVKEGKTVAVACRDFACLPPVADVRDWERALSSPQSTKT